MPISGTETTRQEDSCPVCCSVEVFGVCRNRFPEICFNISLTLRDRSPYTPASQRLLLSEKGKYLGAISVSYLLLFFTPLI
jgi:hypothetical protein